MVMKNKLLAGLTLQGHIYNRECVDKAKPRC
jgi:hypothetical protein